MNPTLQQVANELKKRNSRPFKIEEYLFEQQLKFVSDPAAFKVAVTTRRSGKSTSCAADLTDTAINNPETVGLYITLSRTAAKRIIWPEFKRINRAHKLGMKFNESDLSITFGNGAMIYISGASDRTEIEKFRGMAIIKCYIDECQSFPDYISDLIDDVLAPALMDYSGKLILIGTPGPIPAGFFYNCSQSATWSQHFWTFWDNPHIAIKSKSTHQALLDRELKRRGVGVDNPSIQREWFGKWVLDSDSLVYHYNASINDFNELPQGSYTYLLGVDLGFNDADAIAVLAWSEADPTTYVVEEKISRKQTITDLVAQIEEFRKRYDISKIVVDQGGLGKKIAEELSRRYKIPVQAAEKVRKVEYIELMNDAMRSGRLKAKVGSRFASDCMRVEWDTDKSTPDKKVISNRFHSDICEAILYAWRESYSFTHTPEKPKPKPGDQDYMDAMEEAAMEYFLKQEQGDKDPLW